MATPPASERAGPEDFRGAQRRHRIAARLRAIPAVIAAAVMGIPLSVYLSPVLLAFAILVTDLVNFLVPMPDLGGGVMGRLDDLLDGDPGTLEAIVGILLLWLIPGVVGLVVAYVLVGWRLGAIGGDGIAAAIGGRPPRSGDLEEQQLVDVIGELAVAAGIERPRVLLYDDGPANALVYGRSPDHATVLVGRGILAELDREATQGAMARLIASAVDGDLGLATDVGAVYVTYGLLSTTLNAVVSPSARKRLRAALRALRGAGPGDPASASGIGSLLGLPSDDDVPDDTRSGCLTLLTMGGLITVGMALINLFLTGPLLVFAWRSRVHLADAVGVDLTRNPTAMASAVARLGDGRGLPGSAWLELLLVAGGRPTPADDPRHGQSLSDTGLIASIDPPVRSRLARLAAMGAQRSDDRPGGPALPAGPAAGTRPRRHWGLTLLIVAVIGPLVVLVGILVAIATVLIVYLVALAAFIVLAIVAGPINELLRSLAGH